MTSIRRRLTRELLGAMILLLGGGLTAVYFVALDAVTDQFDSALQAKARAISTMTFQDGNQVRVTFNDHFMPGFEDWSRRDFFQLWDANGTEIARSESLAPGTNLPRKVGVLNRPAQWSFTLPDGRGARGFGFVFRPKNLNHRHEDARELWLVIASENAELNDDLWQLFGLCAGIAALVIAATVWIIPRVLRRDLQPLYSLGEQSTRIDADSLGARFSLDVMPAELRPIAEKLNDLLGRLELSFERERRFSADLAHELRTPLTELRALAECAVKWPEARDPEFERDVLGIADQLERLVAHILALTRGEQGQLVPKHEPLRLDALASEVWSDFADRAMEKNLKAELRLAPVEAIADAALLRAVLTNLFENAIDYTPSGGSIVVALTTGGHGVCIEVSNTTHDLTLEDIPKLFDRFWRKEASRTGGSHLGLGLSLSRAFARSMNWTLSARFDEDHRLTFSLSGPHRLAGA